MEHAGVEMRVLFATSEAYPLAKTGGLADVSRALPIALKHLGIDVRLLMPGYPEALARLERPRPVAKLENILGIADAMLVAGELPDTNIPVLLVDAPSLFRREGGLYQCGDGHDWPDNAARFAFLSHAAAEVASGRTALDWMPDVVHANDWHTGLLPLLLSLQEGPRPSTVFTAHNLAFQGNFPLEMLAASGIPKECFWGGDVEFYGQISFLKAGLLHADRVTTVSPNYAREILTPEFGFGLDGLLRERHKSLSGILNGIDHSLWNPATDAHLPQNFSSANITGKRTCKTELQREFGLPACPDTPLVGFVSRITHQKMADTVLDALPQLVERGAQFVLVGRGDPYLEAEFVRAQRQYEGHVSVHIGYDEALAHKLQAGSDILLAPARFEPCGLTQIYALRYGSLPIVRRTGGLADTVVDASPAAITAQTATGFVFDDASLVGLIGALDNALSCYRRPLTWRRLQMQAMAQNFSWDVSAAVYLSLYREITGATLPPSEEFLTSTKEMEDFHDKGSAQVNKVVPRDITIRKHMRSSKHSELLVRSAAHRTNEDEDLLDGTQL